MTIRVHVACDDAAYRSAIADYLATEREIEVVGVSDEGQVGAAAVQLLAPDVVVLRAAQESDAAQQLRIYRNARGGALIAFCAAGAQAEQYRRAGADGVVLEQEPARKLRAAVKAAFHRRQGKPNQAMLHS